MRLNSKTVTELRPCLEAKLRSNIGIKNYERISPLKHKSSFRNDARGRLRRRYQ